MSNNLKGIATKPLLCLSLAALLPEPSECASQCASKVIFCNLFQIRRRASECIIHVAQRKTGCSQCSTTHNVICKKIVWNSLHLFGVFLRLCFAFALTLPFTLLTLAFGFTFTFASFA